MFTPPKFLFTLASSLDEIADRLAEKQQALERKQKIERLEREARELLEASMICAQARRAVSPQ